MVADLGHEGLLGAVGHDHAVDPATPLQQAENTDFSRRAPAALALAPSAKVAFVGLDPAAERRSFALGLFPEASPPGAVVVPHRRIADPQRAGGVVGGRSQHEGLEDLPLLAPLFVAPLAPATGTLPLPRRAPVRRRMAVPAQLSHQVLLVVSSFHRAASACPGFLLITKKWMMARVLIELGLIENTAVLHTHDPHRRIRLPLPFGEVREVHGTAAVGDGLFAQG